MLAIRKWQPTNQTRQWKGLPRNCERVNLQDEKGPGVLRRLDTDLPAAFLPMNPSLKNIPAPVNDCENRLSSAPGFDGGPVVRP